MIVKKKTIKEKFNQPEFPSFRKWLRILIIFGTLTLFFLIYIFYRASISESNLISPYFVPFLLGLAYENYRLSKDWKSVAFKVIGSLILSFFIFTVGIWESDYDFEKIIEIWPFFFFLIFISISIFAHEKKVIPKLTEGITLIQSISFLYWMYDWNFFKYGNIILISLMIISIFITIYSLIHALTNIPLTRNIKLFLSIWSSIIMIVFSVEYILRVLIGSMIRENPISEVVLIIQFFILGVSSIYILQIFLMLMEYLPRRNRLYGKIHRAEIRQMNNTHIERYSDQQVNLFDSIFCVLYCLTIYFINYTYQWLPALTAIWLVFLTFPLVVDIKNRIIKVF